MWADDLKSVCLDRFGSLRANQKRDVAFSLSQTTTKISAYRASADDQNFHSKSPFFSDAIQFTVDSRLPVTRMVCAPAHFGGHIVTDPRGGCGTDFPITPEVTFLTN